MDSFLKGNRGWEMKSDLLLWLMGDSILSSCLGFKIFEEL